MHWAYSPHTPPQEGKSNHVRSGRQGHGNWRRDARPLWIYIRHGIAIIIVLCFLKVTRLLTGWFGFEKDDRVVQVILWADKAATVLFVVLLFGLMAYEMWAILRATLKK